MFLVSHVAQGLEEALKAGESADILGWESSLSGNEAGIFDFVLTQFDCLNDDSVPPVIANVVAIPLRIQALRCQCCASSQ